MRQVFTVIAVVALLAGCGVKKPLVLPKQGEANQAESQSIPENKN